MVLGAAGVGLSAVDGFRGAEGVFLDPPNKPVDTTVGTTDSLVVVGCPKVRCVLPKESYESAVTYYSVAVPVPTSTNKDNSCSPVVQNQPIKKSALALMSSPRKEVKAQQNVVYQAYTLQIPHLFPQ